MRITLYVNAIVGTGLLVQTTLVNAVAPPACLLSCLNDYARWCPNNHRDMKCISENTANMILCFTTKCPWNTADVATTYFHNIVDAFLSPPSEEFPDLPPEEADPPTIEDPTLKPPGDGEDDNGPPVEEIPPEKKPKHKPPKYGYRKSSEMLMVFDDEDEY